MKALILFAVVTAVLCGCGQPPSPERLTGRWQSSDGRFVLDFRADGTFTKSDASSSDNTSLDMMGIAFIAPSGKWSLEGSELSISFGSAAEGHSMLLHVVSLGDASLVVRFGDHGSVKFIRKV
jgi:hypothetical protein